MVTTLIVFTSCTGDNKKGLNSGQETANEKQIEDPALQLIIDSAGVKGSVLIYHLEKDTYHSNDFEWADNGQLPASTFKITNSIIALETGVAADDSTWFKWDGEKRRMKIWEQDLMLRDAFHLSCVPCYQDVARRIGEKRMNEHLTKFEYGNMKVDTANIDIFWLEGASRISQFQQIDFLKRFYKSALPISERTEKIMKRTMVMEENERYRLSGKTGWSIRGEIDNGWFVGYVETEGNTYFFATNVEPGEQFDMQLFPGIRKQITFSALKQMDIIK